MNLCDLHLFHLRCELARFKLDEFYNCLGDPYDPLMFTYLRIGAYALQAFGESILREDAACPLCVLRNRPSSGQTDVTWINAAVASALDADRQIRERIANPWG